MATIGYNLGKNSGIKYSNDPYNPQDAVAQIFLDLSNIKFERALVKGMNKSSK